MLKAAYNSGIHAALVKHGLAMYKNDYPAREGSNDMEYQVAGNIKSHDAVDKTWNTFDTKRSNSNG